MNLFVGPTDVMKATPTMTGCHIKRTARIQYYTTLLKYEEVKKKQTKKLIMRYRTENGAAENIELGNHDTFQTSIVHTNARSTFQKRIIHVCPAGHYMVIS